MSVVAARPSTFSALNTEQKNQQKDFIPIFSRESYCFLLPIMQVLYKGSLSGDSDVGNRSVETQVYPQLWMDIF